MYMFKDGLNIKINQTACSEEIGISKATLSNIFLRKVTCRKVVALCITKYMNNDAEIDDYFEKVE